jgi:hypothetical protein
MCDGYQEELAYTLQRRATGEALTTAEGFRYLFSDEDEARAFLDGRSDAAELAIVAVAVE